MKETARIDHLTFSVGEDSIDALTIPHKAVVLSLDRWPERTRSKDYTKAIFAAAGTSV